MRPAIVAAAATLFAALCAVAPGPVASNSTAFASVLWSNPIVLFSSNDLVSSPLVLADSAGDVHVLFAANRQARAGVSGGQLMYTRLHDGRWSTPTDVAVAPDGGRVDQLAGAIDSRGVLHVLFYGGVGQPQIFYTRAHVSAATSAAAWSLPVRISAVASANGSLGTADAISVGPDDDVLHVTFAGVDGNVYYRRSTTGGSSWDSTVTIRDTIGADAGADHPRVAADRRGNLYVAWTELQRPTGWPPSGTFFARSTDDGASWSTPVRLAGTDSGSPNLVAANGVLQLVWNTVAEIGQRGHVSSDDGGQTWSAADEVAPMLRGGFTGYPGMALDSAGRLQLVTAIDGGHRSRLRAGVYYVNWDGTEWSRPLFISDGATNKLAVDTPRLAISSGNRLHVVYVDDSRRIWYSTALAEAPTIPPVRVPAPATDPLVLTGPAPTAVVTRATATPVSKTVAVQPPVASAAAEVEGPQVHPLVFALAPIILLNALLLAWRMVHHSRQ